MKIDERIDRYDNYEIAELIDRYVKGDKARAILKRRLIDGILFETLAEEFEISERHIKRLVYKSQEQLFKHI